MENNILDDFLKLITCKYTKKIYRDPVLNPKNGEIVEKNYLIQQNNKIGIPYFNMKSLVNNFIVNFPDFKKDVYDQTPLQIVKKKHSGHEKEVSNIFKEKKYDKIFYYKEFLLNSLEVNCVKHFIYESHISLVKFFLENCINIDDHFIDNKQWRIFHFVLYSRNADLVKFYIKTYPINFEYGTPEDKWTFMHILSYYHANNVEIYELISKKKPNLYIQNKEGNSVFEFLLMYNEINIILEIIDFFDIDKEKSRESLNKLISRDQISKSKGEKILEKIELIK